MKKVIIERMLSELENELQNFTNVPANPLQQWPGALKVAREAIASLRSEVLKQPFPDNAAEIHFFKKLKPLFSRWVVFYTELYNIESNMPKIDAIKQSAFIEQELSFIERFFRQHAYAYQYYKLDADELDHLYFLRGAKTQASLLSVFPDLDPAFSTELDHLYSKFMGLELLQEELLKRLRNATSGTGDPEPAGELMELRWTGDKVNLVEVIYAIYFTGQVNNGNADISLLIRFMEKHMQIDLSRAYRDFIDIRNRKVSSPTRYIDQMRESIYKRIDDDLAFKVEKRRAFRGGN